VADDYPDRTRATPAGPRWITPFGGTWALAGRSWMSRHVLCQTEDGALQSQRIWPTRGGTGVVRLQDLRQRWRLTRPGDWLVLLLPEARERYRYGAYGPGTEEVVGAGPRRDVREALDAAATLPIGDQLAACGFEPVAAGPIVPETASGPNGELEVYRDRTRPDRIAVHLVSVGHLAVVGLERLVVWDPTLQPRIPPDDRDGLPLRVPAGLGPDLKPFGGRLDDLVVAHFPGAPAAEVPPDEAGSQGDYYRWSSPSAHYHTASGELICGESDGRAADVSNDPGPAGG
jgi:hypothetical protein